uniref:Uncharacterized protein n=1 Tax=Anopheles maculatus TaxID=74869 RepID=A0A182SAN9_9DIPT
MLDNNYFFDWCFDEVPIATRAMHSGSSISPKHPAIPVSIGIASLVLEGRSSALDDSSINASATVCATSSALVSGHGIGSGGGAGGGSSTGSGAAGGSGDDEEDGGFCGQRRASESAGGASSLQQCSLMAINESQKSLALTCCHTSNETQRINLKLQQIRSSCPSTSKDEVQQLVTVSGEPSRLSSGGGHRNEREIYESFSNVVPQHDPAARATSSSPSSTVASWFSHELPISASTATAGVVIYSGFEKMNVLGTVSPIKNHPMGNSFINFSSSSSVSAIPSSLSLSSVQPRKPPASSKLQSPSLSPREGPHCEQFLKKIGLTKSDTAEGSEHHCSYRNKYGKHRCAFRVELEEEEDEYDPSMVAGVIEGDGGDGDDGLQLTSAAISHREKQLLKYRKRMLKREKKKKNGNAGEGSSNGSVTSSNSSSGRGSVNDQNGSSTDGSSYLSAKHYNMCGQLGSIGHNAGPKMPSNAGGALGFSNGVSVIANDECSNGSCRNALTSSINSIQPPLYSSNDHHQAM